MTETPTDAAIRVLMVEDEEADSLSTRALLEQTGQGFEIGWATSFEEGLSALRHDGYDVALVDYQLGGPTGLDLIRAAVKEGLTPPMILLTGRDDREVDTAATQAGAADFLVKSEITPALLERALRYAVERQRTQRLLAQLARTDALTGLLNRFGFNERLDETLGRAKRSGSSGVVLFLDLDGFKPVNDRFGHGVGDALLKHVASILRGCVRREDVPARLGGDEFGVLLEDTGPSYDAAKVAERLVAAIDQPYEHDNGTAYITASIGVAVFPDDGDAVESLIKSADAAMYEVKETGRNGFSFFSQEMAHEFNVHQEMRHALHEAYEREEFLLYYQPQVDATTGRVLGAEALLRWQRGDQLVGPAAFIPALEQSGLIAQGGQVGSEGRLHAGQTLAGGRPWRPARRREPFAEPIPRLQPGRVHQGCARSSQARAPFTRSRDHRGADDDRSTARRRSRT